MARDHDILKRAYNQSIPKKEARLFVPSRAGIESYQMG
jgi:hypothetical protein